MAGARARRRLTVPYGAAPRRRRPPPSADRPPPPPPAVPEPRMTAVQSAPTRPPAPPEELTAIKPVRLPRSAIFADAVVIGRRNLTRSARTPHLLVLLTIPPVMFVLLF